MHLVASVHLSVCPCVCALLFQPIGFGPDFLHGVDHALAKLGL